MARYVVAATKSGPTGFRPWQSRLGEFIPARFVIPAGRYRKSQMLGDYKKAVFYVPTQSQGNEPVPVYETGGLGDYKKAAFCVPTQSQDNEPVPAYETGGLSGLDFSSIPGWVWLAGAVAGWYFYFGPGKRRA